jgi:D-lactate dehydrogenase
MGNIGSTGLDVYERKTIFFGNHINKKLRIIYTPSSAPNVLITGHQGFLTKEALEKNCTDHHC